MTDLQSRTISTLRPLLMVLIVFIHVGIRTENYGIAANIIYNIISQITAIAAVPLFFIISGYLFFQNIENSKGFFSFKAYKNKLKKRLVGLVLPYFIWNLIAVLYIIVLQKIHFNSDYFTWVPFKQGNISLKQFFLSFISLRADKPLLFQMWFLRDLILINFLAPIIYYLNKYTKSYINIFILIIFILFYKKNYFFEYEFVAIVFYSIGAGLKIQNIDFTKINELPSFLIYFVYFASFLFFTTSSKYIVIPTGIIAITYTAIKLTKNNKISEKISLLGSYSFFLYALHTFIIRIIQHFLSTIFTDNTFFAVFIYFLSVILTIGISFIIYMIMRQFFPKMELVLCGKR